MVGFLPRIHLMSRLDRGLHGPRSAVPETPRLDHSLRLLHDKSLFCELHSTDKLPADRSAINGEKLKTKTSHFHSVTSLKNATADHLPDIDGLDLHRQHRVGQNYCIYCLVLPKKVLQIGAH